MLEQTIQVTWVQNLRTSKRKLHPNKIQQLLFSRLTLQMSSNRTSTASGNFVYIKQYR
jgi:hypothetical protein